MSTASIDFFTKLNRTISVPRLQSYKQTGGTDQDALCRYLWNTALCESLYPSFQILEVAFRNAVHSEIAHFSKDPRWLTNELGILYIDELTAIKAAKWELKQKSKILTEDYLVGELTFGFWTSLLDSRYDRMWPKIIANVFPYIPKVSRTRGDISKMMNPVRRLRNAAFHHHSIWHWKDLVQQHSQMQLLISYICTSVAKMSQNIDRFPVIYAAGSTQFKSQAEAMCV